jgi:hypothetical protein
MKTPDHIHHAGITADLACVFHDIADAGMRATGDYHQPGIASVYQSGILTEVIPLRLPFLLPYRHRGLEIHSPWNLA